MNKQPMFLIEEWNSAEKYAQANIIGYEPMTAKELDTEDKQDEELYDHNNYLEEKFDGTRALVYVFERYNRVFSRRISKKTGFYVENTDSVPQIRDIVTPTMKGTILDGEMYIPERGFQASSAVMNCKYDKAIERQEELGFQVFHAFDILFFRGKDLRDFPLRIRKMYLRIAVAEINSPYIKCVDYFSCGALVDTRPYEKEHGKPIDLFNKLEEDTPYQSFYTRMLEAGDTNTLPPRAFYEYIVATGGEGLIIKSKDGIYQHKRGWEYSKIKAFLTREMILIGFTEPTKEYTGKAPKDWEYYENGVPVTKHYYFNQVGNMKLGVLLTEEELSSIPKNKRGEIHKPSNFDLCVDDEGYYIMEVCECSGYTDEQREYFTEHIEELLGSVIEVKANGVMKDSGRMRHPRFLRLREDKAPEQCIWSDHVGDN